MVEAVRGLAGFFRIRSSRAPSASEFQDQGTESQGAGGSGLKFLTKTKKDLWASWAPGPLLGLLGLSWASWASLLNLPGCSKASTLPGRLFGPLNLPAPACWASCQTPPCTSHPLPGLPNSLCRRLLGLLFQPVRTFSVHK